ncbi:MAG TPA: MFS transporter [Candidatus Dormibacteraeota bacterium]|nr:MFS transporter [Candidatus Dormibacteraeota bacterium]
MTSRPTRDLTLINAAAFLRSFGVGMMGVVLGIYLFRTGLTSFAIGLVIAVGLAGAALATVLVSLIADRVGRRSFLFSLSLLNGVAGIALALSPSLPVLAILAFVGMLNGTGTDRSAASSLDQAVLPGLVSDVKRTWTLACYNVLLDGGGALGAMAAALPILLQRQLSISMLRSYRLVFFGYFGLCLVVAALYLFLSPAVEVGNPSGLASVRTKIAPESKRIVAKLTALFSLDAFGGGFLTDALVTYWFFRRFGIGEEGLALVFFTVHVLNAASHLGAAWLARRIGLVKTMVFTHLPSSLFLIAVPFAPTFKIAILLFLCREALVEMDVPTRQSYVAAVVLPNERTFASGFTNLARNVFWAVGSSVAGLVMQNIAFSAPLVIGSGMKVAYDLALFRAFRKCRPPEERERGMT